jgi:cytidine deaminase
LSGKIEELIAAAKDAARHAYAPYSNFHVGAALRMQDGSIVSAANFENASFGLALCAEIVAIAKANSEGKRDQIREIAIAGGPAGAIGSGQAIPPCGRCRQIIKEIADITQQDIPVHCAHIDGYDTHLLSELLPYAFGPANLK